MSEKPFQGIKEACNSTGLSQFYFRQGIKAGTIPFIKSGKKILINVPAVLEQLDKESKKAVTA